MPYDARDPEGLKKAMRAVEAQEQSDSATLLTERGSVHGDWLSQARCTSAIKAAMGGGNNYYTLPPEQREAIDMIAVKLGRILCGDPNHADHWRDIAGYATLAANALEKSDG